MIKIGDIVLLNSGGTFAAVDHGYVNIKKTSSILVLEVSEFGIVGLYDNKKFQINMIYLKK